MPKGLFLFFVAVTAVSVGQPFEDAIPRDQRSLDFNEYYVYTKPITTVPIQLTPDNMDILNDQLTVVVIHGHNDNYRSAMNVDIARGILEVSDEDVNVLIVDWSVHAGQSYSFADGSVPTVGVYLADYLTLLSSAGVTPENMHIVGFDLGAHVAGWAGRTLRNRGTPVARITGLDPSQSNNRLTNTDATYVEVIHTDSSILGSGIGGQLGDADFFPNGGTIQPGCLTHSCYHNRAWQLFAASLGWNTFLANCCNSMSQMQLNGCTVNSFQEMGNNRLAKFIGSCGTGIYRINTKNTFPY